ncbi:YcaO-like family protein [Legionella sp. W05-934-2]|uniref:YcaO-like family protein n=1 Tax=Legionella sp. W05-934-2 TaxID=1198649 RepID=UPI003463701F
MNNSLEAINQRAYKLDDALLIGLEEAAKNHITPLFKGLNNIKHEDTHLSTYLCSTNNHQLKLSFIGGASGFTQLSKIKALYESLEKSISFKICNNNLIDELYFFSTKSSPSTQFLLEKRLMPKLLLQEIYQNNRYPWIELIHYQNPTQKIHYPLGLIYASTPRLKNFRQDYLSELSDNTGLAIGATTDEAIIHGINQWVERDAYSLFLLKTIINKNPCPARLLLKETLPENIAKIVSTIEKQFNEKLIIMDMTSDINIPSFVVSFTKQNMLLQPQGFGTSLFKEKALIQALFESIQYKDRFNQNAKKYREENVALLSSCPLLLKAMIGDLKYLIVNKLYTEIDWNNISSYSLHESLPQQIQFMVNLLAKQGANIYTQVLYKSSIGVAITYTLIPELENFSLIRDAKFLPIKTRGLEIFNEQPL